MKKLLVIAFILSLAVMGFASPEARGAWIQLVGTPLNINDYVNTPYAVHDTDFSLSVVCSAYPEVTVTSENVATPLFCSVFMMEVMGTECWAFVDQQTPAWAVNWPAGSTLTFTLTYLPTNLSATYVLTVEEGGADMWMADFMGIDPWNIHDILQSGGPTPVTYTLNIAINDDVLTTPGTYTINGQPYQAQLVDDNDEVNDLIGTYTISAAPEGYYWLVNPIEVSAANFDPDTNIANITFVLVANPDSWTYKLMLTASDGGAYNFTGPVSGVTGTEYSTGPQTTSNNPYLGAYTVTSEPPMGYTWVNTQVELGPDDFISAKADYVFMATKQFVLQLMPITYTLNIVFPDGYTITGPGGPFTTSPAVVTDNDDTVNDLIGNVYTASDAPAGFHWVVNPIEVTAEMFENNAATITFALEQDEEPPVPPVPVELSSFTATLTGQFYVQLAWTTQTETQMVGYRVYRSTTADQSTIELIDNPLVPATNTSTAQNYTVVDKDVLIGQTYYYWLEAVDYNNSNFHGPVSVTVTGNVPPVLPEVTEMKNAYPNPFKANSSTNIEVSLKAGDTGTLSIYNVQGQLVKIVSLTEGTHMVNWNGRDTRGNACGSGIYFYKLSTQSMNQTKKMVIVK